MSKEEQKQQKDASRQKAGDFFGLFPILHGYNMGVPETSYAISVLVAIGSQPVYVGKVDQQQTGKTLTRLYGDILSEKGISGLWRGLGPSLGKGPIKSAMKATSAAMIDEIDGNVATKTAISTGVITFGITPLEKVVAAMIGDKKKSTFGVLQGIWGQGVKGIYAGWRPSALQTGIEMSLVYGARAANDELGLDLSPATLGGITGVTRTLLSQPFDTAKSWIQQSSTPGMPIPTMRDAYNELGLREMFRRGLVLRGGLGVLGMMTTFIAMGYKDYLKEQAATDLEEPSAQKAITTKTRERE